MSTKDKLKNVTPTFGNTVLPAVIDKQVKKLSKMQVDLMYSGMEADDFNEMSEMIGNLKEFMVNCRSCYVPLNLQAQCLK